MGKYDHLSKEELIQRIERLEADLEKATLTPSASDNELEMRQSQHTINFLNILMDTILSNVFVEITVKDIFNGFRYIYFNKAAEEFTGISLVFLPPWPLFQPVWPFPLPKECGEKRGRDH